MNEPGLGLGYGLQNIVRGSELLMVDGCKCITPSLNYNFILKTIICHQREFIVNPVAKM